MPISKNTVCSRGHRFQKSAARPTCPVCWPGRYNKPAVGPFPGSLSAPALRALETAKIKDLATLATWTELEFKELHGIGPKAVSALKSALRREGLAFTKPPSKN